MTDETGYCDVADRPLPEPVCGLDLPCPEHDNGTPFIFTVDRKPQVGTLGRYAKHWESAYYSHAFELSSTVLTWDDTSDPITYRVRVVPEGKMDNEFITYRFSVPGLPDTATVTIDGRA